MRRSRADRNGLLERSRKRLRVPSLSRQERRPRDRGRCGGCGLPRGSDGAELPAGSDGGPLPGGPESSRTDCGGAASSDGSGVSVEGLFPARAAVLHIRERLSRRPVRGFPHDSGTPTRMSVLSGRAPMCRATPSAHGRISPALNARTFPHDSADPSLAGPGRMCNTASAAPCVSRTHAHWRPPAAKWRRCLCWWLEFRHVPRGRRGGHRISISWPGISVCREGRGRN